MNKQSSFRWFDACISMWYHCDIYTESDGVPLTNQRSWTLSRHMSMPMSKISTIATEIVNHSEAKWGSWRLRSPTTHVFVQKLVRAITAKQASKLCIARLQCVCGNLPVRPLKKTSNAERNTLRNNDVVITSKRRHFDVITSKWRRFDVITTLLLCHVFRGVTMWK